jgi:hypothetical protein
MNRPIHHQRLARPGVAVVRMWGLRPAGLRGVTLTASGAH